MEYPVITFTSILPITYSTWLPTGGLNNIVIKSGQTITLYGKQALYALRYVKELDLDIIVEYVSPPAPPTPPPAYNGPYTTGFTSAFGSVSVPFDWYDGFNYGWSNGFGIPVGDFDIEFDDAFLHIFEGQFNNEFSADFLH